VIVTAYLRVDGVQLMRLLPRAFTSARPGDSFEVEAGGWTVEVERVEWGVTPSPHCSIVLPDLTTGSDATDADREQTARDMAAAGWRP
jgi:hypothetical protein